jgi:hypothetical protein
VELLTRRRPGSGCAVLILALVGGCRAETPSAPSKLIDGSPAAPPAVVLEGVDEPSLATVVRVTPGDAAVPGSRAASCIAATGVRSGGAVVERVGVTGRTITFLGAGRRTAHACDASSVPGPSDSRWCGHAFDQLEYGRLRDPRLSLTCRFADGYPVGFAWIQPSAAATYIAVRHSGYAEVYTAAADAPLRVTTADVDLMSSRATFSISEHAENGRRVRSYELEAQVAG